jgi:hypothetical protein
VRCRDATPSSNAKRHKPSRGGATPSAAQTAWLRKRSPHVRRRCFPSLRSAGILVAFISGEASCITRLSRRTPNGVRALHALHSLGAAHIYVRPHVSSAAIAAFLAGVSFLLPLVAPMLRPPEAKLGRRTLIVFACLMFGGLLSFGILLLGDTPRPMSDTNWWLHKSGLVLGAWVVFLLDYRYGPRDSDDKDRFIVGLLSGALLGAMFHWIAPAGTDTYAVAVWLAGIGGACGFLWELRFRKRRKGGK